MAIKNKKSKKVHSSTADLIGRVHLLVAFLAMHAECAKSKQEHKALSFAADQTANLLNSFLDELSGKPKRHPADPQRN